MKITSIRLDRMRLPLDPPFHAAWDPVPRRHFDATLVTVETDEGVTGHGSGDTMDGFEPFEPLFTGRDPLAIAEHVRNLESIGFHAGRYWPLEAALWDILGQVAGQPVSVLFGGASSGPGLHNDTWEWNGTAWLLRTLPSAPSARSGSALAYDQSRARIVLFGLPPGRVGERDPIVAGAPVPERALPASIAKRRLIEALRDVALEDKGLADAISPVLVEMSSSIAKGEWQASVQALTQLRARHGAVP